MYNKLTVNMMVENVQRTLKFYKDILQFEFVMAVSKDNSEVIFENNPDRELVYALVKHNTIEIMFQAAESLSVDIPAFSGKPIDASVSFYFEVEDANLVYEELKDKIKIAKEIYTTWYGMREFYVYDCNGYILGFASPQK
ncbi:MAG: VOC family protein [Clostridia bacterium]|nr:VOC family protein [Clostridia bacterium]